MPKVKDIDIKKLSVEKKEFMSALKKVSQKSLPNKGMVKVK